MLPGAGHRAVAYIVSSIVKTFYHLGATVGALVIALAVQLNSMYALSYRAPAYFALARKT